MNINFNSAYGIYQANRTRPSETEPFHPSQSVSAGAKSENTDQISISRAGARQSEVDRLARAIVAEIERSASPERLKALQSAVENKTYRVPTEELAGALAERWFGVELG